MNRHRVADIAVTCGPDQMREGNVMESVSERDVDNLLEILDGFCEAGERRMKLDVSGETVSGTAKKSYHHGCCDIGSPWAKGTAFDVLEDLE